MWRAPMPVPPSSGLSLGAFPRWFLSLYRRPAAFFVTVVAIPLLVACAWLYLVNERQWRAREGEDLLVAARLAARIIQEELARTREMGDAISSRPPFLAAVLRGDRTALHTHLQLLLDVSPMIDHVRVADAHGALLAEISANPSDAPRPAPSAGEAASHTVVWQHPVSGVYLRDEASGEKVVGVSSPIRQGEAVLGVLQVQYRLQELARWLAKIRIEPSGFVYVADHRGRLVLYPFQLLPGAPKDVSGWAPVQRPGSEQGELVRFVQGRPRRAWTASVVVIEPFGWRVIAQQPDAAMLKPFHRIAWSFALLMLVLAAFLSVPFVRWASLHTAALRLLAQQARLLKLSQQRHARARMRQRRRRRRGTRDAD